MTKEWPTQEEDMNTAIAIIDKYKEFNEGQPVGLVDIVVSSETEEVDIKTPDWIVELANNFAAKYGLEKGSEITQKVLTKCLLTGQTIH